MACSLCLWFVIVVCGCLVWFEALVLGGLSVCCNWLLRLWVLGVVGD